MLFIFFILIDFGMCRGTILDYVFVKCQINGKVLFVENKMIVLKDVKLQNLYCRIFSLWVSLFDGYDTTCLNWFFPLMSPFNTTAIAWSPHHHGLLASGGGTADRCIRFWNTLTGQPMQSVDTGSQVCNLAWSKHASELVSYFSKLCFLFQMFIGIVFSFKTKFWDGCYFITMLLVLALFFFNLRLFKPTAAI